MNTRLAFCATLLAFAAPALVGQAWAGTNVYGGYDISGGHETAYGETRGWRVVSGAVDGKFAYCAGELADGDTVWRLGYDTMQWQLGVPYMASPGEWQGEYEIDGRRMPASGVAGDGWSFMWLGLQELDEVRNGNEIVLDIGRASIPHPLKGTAAVITKIEECVSRRGMVGNASVAASAQTQADHYPTFEACQPAGSVRTERDGPAASVTFRVDKSVGATLSLNWIAHDGQVHSYGQIAPGQSMEMNTYVGHLWMATDGGSCAYQEVEPGARSITFVVDAPPDTGGSDTGKLPGTGLTQEQAAALIGRPAPAAEFGDYYAGCKWAINETPFPGGDYLLYYAPECKGRRSLLEFSGGAQFAELAVADSAYAEGAFIPPGYPLVRIADAGQGDARANVLVRARAAIEDPAMKKKCGILPVAETGLPADHIVVGLLPAHRQEKPEYSEPYGAVGLCGPFGENDGVSFWRIFQGSAWFFNLGQDAFQDIAPESLTLVTADRKGGWKRAE
ncbi:MAG: hypothetical protein BroJett030_31750 [Alphaproteobacteria bacterium]|nr:MAG: hypothetical protein BroJett030_31750 [Alphaproteobacteria bacterium]